MWGGNAELRQEMLDEAMIVLLQGMQNEFLSFSGKHFNFSNLWMALKPVQTPHPPFWYGENAVNAGKLRANLVCHGSNADVAVKLGTYLAALQKAKPSWQNGVCHNDAPIYGATLRVYLAENEKEAVDRARESYEVYMSNFRKPQPDDIVADGGRKPRGAPPPKFGPTAISFEQGIAGESVDGYRAKAGSRHAGRDARYHAEAPFAQSHDVDQRSGRGLRLLGSGRS
jgi:alkanesulfonate monooxygenase SsuD/methylene tetrahydromethanopterin reductase-like flavin-dependent oxidoreductase (luciferase family)